MLPRKVILLIMLASIVAAGCSRLTFIKPKLERSDMDDVGPAYDLPVDSNSQGRIAAMDRVALAGQQLRAGNLDEAEGQAQAALKANPNSGDAYTLLAVIADQRGQAATAGKYYAKAVALAPTSGAANNNYGAWLCSNGQPAESLVLFDRALADPGYQNPATALANAGTCALKAGQVARADRDLRRAIQLNPGNPVALASLAKISYDQARYMDARAFSERRLAAAPATLEVLQLASQIEQKLGDSAAAARYVQRISTEFPQARAPASGDASQ